MSKRIVRPNRKLSLPEAAKYTISAIILAVGLVGAFLLYQLRESTGRQESDALIPLVETAAVTDFQGELDLVVSGTVVPFREIRISAQVGGRIKKKYPECEAGTYVREGTKLLEIDPEDYQLEIKTMNSEILQADRTLEETEEEIRGAVRNLEIAQTDMKLRKQEYQRYDRLKDSLSATEYDAAKRNLLNTESQLTERKNIIDMLHAKRERLKATRALINNRLEKAELDLDRTIVKAPVDGVVVRESVEQGDFVNVASELLTFEDTSRAEVLCTLTPGELDWLRQRAPQESLVDAAQFGASVYQLPRVPVEIFEQPHPEAIWKGVLERFDGIGRNEMTKSIPCRIVVGNPVLDAESRRRVLVRGMYVKCRVVIPVDGREMQLAAFPTIAVRPGDYVWIVRDEKLKKLDIQVVDRTPLERDPNKKLVVVSMVGDGLKIGDQVVVSPLPQPTEGGRVLLRDSANPNNQQTAETADPAIDVDRDERTEISAAEESRPKINVRTKASSQANQESFLDRGAP